MLWLRGVNIFNGYLDDPVRSAEVLRDGWFKTGDLARFDEDGFLFIEGRLSRFSKIGGEMVPHETVESAVIEALALPKDERLIAIVGVPDEAKGEALVLLAAREVEPRELRAKLSAAGRPNLWIPKTIKRVEAIPLLASGKLDLAACQQLASGNS
jgi:acyl-[acyl-carrier-protein]-phospholipid O-acyltransferase/long-chain-fatty-acid--[acyl-carrier-protein] ligase